jgi:hypothetical protein
MLAVAVYPTSVVPSKSISVAKSPARLNAKFIVPGSNLYVLLIVLAPLAGLPFVAAAQTPQSPLAEPLSAREAEPLTISTNRIL